jgi:predicted transcriptional regulator
VDETIALLERLGFSTYEARAYLALVQRSPLNGYEVAKLSRVPRPNIYAVLQRLEERGAVVRLDTPTGVRYAAVPPTELVQRLETRFQEVLRSAQQALERVAPQVEPAYVWNVHGYAAVLDQAGALLGGARERLLLALWSREARALVEQLDRAVTRGVAVTTLCLEGCPEACGGCRGRIYRYRMGPEPGGRPLVIVADDDDVLAGEVGDGVEALAVRTRQRLLVELAGWYVRHSIALAAILNDLGVRLEALLAPETKAVLATVGPGRDGGGWLEHLRQLFGQSPDTSPAEA